MAIHINIKRGQVSLEVMYAIGTMIIIFLIITGVNVNRQFELRTLDEYSTKADKCYELANRLTGVENLGDGSSSLFYTSSYLYYVNNEEQAITVSDPNADTSAVDASCTFLSPLSNTTILHKLTNYNIIKQRGVVYLEPLP